MKPFWKTPKILFPGQQENEEICLLTRRHWATLVPEIIIWLVFAAIPIWFDLVIVPRFPSLSEGIYLPIFNLVKTVYVMFLVGGLFYIWILYYLNFQIITNERIVDVTQKNLLHHTTSELHLGRIQDVTAEIKGFMGNLFNYGNVYIQTAGEQVRFEFDQVPNPHRIEKLILDLYEKLPAEEKMRTE